MGDSKAAVIAVFLKAWSKYLRLRAWCGACGEHLWHVLADESISAEDVTSLGSRLCWCLRAAEIPCSFVKEELLGKLPREVWKKLYCCFRWAIGSGLNPTQACNAERDVHRTTRRTGKTTIPAN